MIGALGGIQGLAPPTPITYGIPAIGITGYTGFGDSSTAPDISNDHVFRRLTISQWSEGNIRSNSERSVRRDQYNQEGNQFVDGNFRFHRQRDG